MIGSFIFGSVPIMGILICFRKYSIQAVVAVLHASIIRLMGYLFNKEIMLFVMSFSKSCLDLFPYGQFL